MTGVTPLDSCLLYLNTDPVFFSFVFTGIIARLKYSQFIVTGCGERVLSAITKCW